MRFAQQRTSPYKHSHSPSKCLPNQTNTRLQADRSYIHYNNGIYMGGVTSYKRNGQGILLLDDGSSLISQCCFDTMTGHNIIFRENCIISVLCLKNGMLELVLRTGQCIIKIPYYEKETLPNGSGLLIDYQSMKIYHILFQSGRIIKKIAQSNRKILEQVMRQELHMVIDQRHQNALKFNFKFSNGIRMMKEGKKITIGYIDNRHHLEGVAFKIKINEDAYDNFAFPLEIKCIERGFYLRNRLQNFGQRYFSNGNLYIGEFQDDAFNGQGLLLYPHEEKWVFGQFEGERLKKMISINLGDNPSKQSIKACLKEVHEFNTKNWIGTDILLFEWSSLTLLFREVFNAKVTDVVIEKQREQREEEQRLGRIQEHFSSEPPSSAIDKVIEEQMCRNQRSPQKVVLDYASHKPKVLEIEPRNIENEEHWLPSTTKHRNLRYSPSKVLTPTHSTNWKVQDSRKTQSKYSTAASPNKNNRSPYKRFNYPTNI